MAATITKVNFELLSDMMAIQRRDVPLADTTLANPLNALALIDGEWMTFNSAYKLIRAADLTQANGTVATSAVPYVLWSELGRTDVQANIGFKAPILWLGFYQADTRVYDTALGGGITAVNQPLKVAVVTIGTRKYSGLMGHAGAGDADPVVGYVEKLPDDNGGKLRFRSGGRTFT
jgi:hypothetical protein